MKKDWSDFLLPCSAIEAVFTHPQGVTKLSERDEKKLVKLSLLDEKTDDDWLEINALRAKAALFLDPPLSKTAINMLTEKYAWFKYQKKIASKGGLMACIEKGNVLEPQAIKIMSDIDKANYVKNELKYSNEFIIGIPDIVDLERGIIIDTKVSWNVNTFLKSKYGLDDKYWFQAQGYMELFNVNFVDVCFLLLDTPQDIVQREFAKMLTSYVLGEIDTETYNEKIDSLTASMAYSNIPLKRRVIRYRVNREPSVMTIIYNKVLKCREFLAQLDKEHMKNKIIVTLPPKKVNATNREEDNTEPDTN